ncbi:unnamed protein product [Pleuronectes platessa]|uniref:Intraflagellar transport protein 57 homolog n=1 Tax=Pleuronectes platessa TaxID=8262 RepID=A0A9N7VHI6_PLEPL|nr:unnamed protein product [Pleuronectes platessa]
MFVCFMLDQLGKEALRKRGLSFKAPTYLTQTTELESVLPEPEVPIKTDKNWRIHVAQMHQHRDRIRSSLEKAKSYLYKLQEDVSKNPEKVSSREKYNNNQLI